MSVLEVPPIPDLPIYQLSVEKYHELIRAGVLDADDRIELLRGWMVPKMSNNPPHSVATHVTADALRAFVPKGYCIRTEKPITLSDSEPEPDVAVVSGNLRQYKNRYPVASEVALIIEVSSSSLGRDRKIKKEIYAEAMIPCYWIVDVTSRKVEVYTQPSQSNFSSREEFTTQVPLSIADHGMLMVPVADLLP